MKDISLQDIKALRVPKKGSHKGQNGRLMVIGGSGLFHAASMWALDIASRIVDLVHYASVPQNNEIVQKSKERFSNGIVVPRGEIEDYLQEDDCILIGPGMMRSDEDVSDSKYHVSSVDEINTIEDEGVQTALLTNYLLKKYPDKQWVIDAGALQMVDVSLIPERAILTPHAGEFRYFFDKFKKTRNTSSTVALNEKVRLVAKTLSCIVLHKGEEDIVCSSDRCERIKGGNEGMTKGGTGDVLAGLIAAFACTNDPYIATVAGSYINKRAGDVLYATQGPFFNTSELLEQIPQTMKDVLY